MTAPEKQSLRTEVNAFENLASVLSAYMAP